MVVGDHVDAARRGRAQRGRGAGDARVVREELAGVAAFVGRLDQQRQVGAPVAGHHGVGARGLDLGDVGCEVTHLGDRVQVFANDLDVRALAGQGFLGVLGNLHAVRIVLAQDVDLLDVLLAFHEAGHGFHLHRGVGIETEVPVAALVVGQIGIDGRVVQVDDFLARVAFVVLGDRIGQRQRDGRTVALDDVAHALVDRGLQRVQAFGRAQLVVDAGDFELHARRVAGTAELFSEELVALQLVDTDRAHQAALRVDADHFDDFALLRHGRTGTCHQACDRNEFQCLFHTLSPVDFD